MAVPPDPPQSLVDDLESALRVPFSPEASFARYRDLPPPGYGRMAAGVVFWSLLGQLTLLVLTQMRVSGAAGLGMGPTALLLAAAAALSVPLSFTAAAALHLLAVLAGGRQGFARSYQVLSLLGALAPISTALVFTPLPLAWVVPTLLATYLAAHGVGALHRLAGGQAWMVVGLAGGLAAGGQVAFRRSIESFSRGLENRAVLYSAGAPAGSPGRMAQPPAIPAAFEPPGIGPRPSYYPGHDPRNPFPGSQAAAPVQAAAAAAPQASSGLSMLRSGGAVSLADEEGPLPWQQAPDMSPAQAQAVGAGMIQAIQRQMRSNPALLESLTPEQRARFQQVLAGVDRQAANLGGAGAADEAEARRILDQAMRQMFGASAPPAKARPTRKAGRPAR